MYHDVCDDSRASGFAGADADLYKISTAEFAAHLDAISGKIEEKPSRIIDWKPFESAVFITFDDGGRSALEAAAMLEEKNWRGHFFITTGRIGTENFVGKSQIIELHKRGHVVGSHSDSHPLRMASLSRDKIFDEWRVSADKLAAITGEKTIAASVPGGLYSKTVAECAAENGIEFLFNSEPTTKIGKVGYCFVFGRYAVQNSASAAEISAIAGGDLSPRLKQSLIWTAKKPLKKIGGESFLTVRKFLINRKTEK